MRPLSPAPLRRPSRLLPRLFCLPLVLLSLAQSLPVHAATYWSSDIAGRPLDSSIIGHNGWTAANIDSGNDSDASIVAHPSEAGKRILKLTSTSTLASTSRRTILTNSFEKVSGPIVEATISVAFEWTGTSSLSAGFAFNTNESHSPVLIGFTATGGLTFNGTYANLESPTILTTAQMAKGEFYEFKFTFNYESRLFDMTVSGVDASDQPILLTLTDIGFRSNTPTSANGIDGVKLINSRGDYIQYYVDDITIQSIPEPGSLATLALGAGGLLVLGRFLRPSTQH